MAYTFGLVNHSTTLTQQQARIIARAIDEHMEHFAQEWPSLTRSQCEYIRPNQEASLVTRLNVIPLYVLDSFPPALSGSAGVHLVSGEETSLGFPPTGLPNGRPIGYAAMNWILTGPPPTFTPYPITVDPFLTTPDPVFPTSAFASLAGVLGHEATEIAADPFDLNWVPAPPFAGCAAAVQDIVPPFNLIITTEGAPFFAVDAVMEAGDPSGRVYYDINVGAQPVSMQDFPTQSYFRMDYWCDLNGFPVNELSGGRVFTAIAPPPGTKYSYLNVLPGPFTFAPGGYLGFLVQATSGMGDIIVPPDYTNPIYGPICAGVPAPPVPGPGQARVGLPYPRQGLGRGAVLVPPAFLANQPTQWEAYARRHTTLFASGATPAISYGTPSVYRRP
jgi:hypothetical protein